MARLTSQRLGLRNTAQPLTDAPMLFTSGTDEGAGFHVSLGMEGPDEIGWRTLFVLRLSAEEAEALRTYLNVIAGAKAHRASRDAL